MLDVVVAQFVLCLGGGFCFALIRKIFLEARRLVVLIFFNFGWVFDNITGTVVAFLEGVNSWSGRQQRLSVIAGIVVMTVAYAVGIGF